MRDGWGLGSGGRVGAGLGVSKVADVGLTPYTR